MTFGLVKLEDDMALVTELTETDLTETDLTEIDLTKLVFRKNLRNKSMPTVSQTISLRIFLLPVCMDVMM